MRKNFKYIAVFYCVIFSFFNVLAQPPADVTKLPPGHPLERRDMEAEDTSPPEVVSGMADFQPKAPASGAENKVDGDRERISLDLKGIDIVDLFRLLSVKTDLTIVPSKKVAGRVSLFLNKVTFQDALDVILITQGLAAEQRGDILMIMTDNEYKVRYGKDYDEKRKFCSLNLRYAKPSAVFSVLGQLKSDIGKIIVDEASGTVIIIDIPEKTAVMEEVARELDQPLDTEVFSLQNAAGADLKEHLSGAITAGAGEVYVDDRTNKVVVSDLPDKMKKLKRMIYAFDADTKQVLIEAEILQIVLRDEYQQGINWEKLFNGTVDGLDLVGTFPVSPSFSPSVELTSSSMNISVGELGADSYDFVVDLLDTFGDVKILSRPKIAAVNNEEARIMVGSREAYVTQTQSQAEASTVTSESVEFIDVGIKLNVIPTINDEDFVTLKIKPEISSVRDTLTTAIDSTIPIVETSEAETTVRVKDGSTIMIGGLMKEEKRYDESSTPLLSKIPVLGHLFRSEAKLDNKTELVIFIRPRIIDGKSPWPGAKPQEIIPAEVFPEDMKKALIAAEIDKIAASGSEPVLADGDKVKEKLKGLKKY